MKPLAQSKTRLAGTLADSDREALSANLFARVVRAAVKSNLNRVLVVGGNDAIESEAYSLGAEWLPDCGNGLNACVQQTISHLAEQDTASIYLPADLPLVTPDDIDALILASEHGKKLTLCPADRDGGTNAIVVPVGSKFRLQLGENSFAKHIEQADQLGIEPTILKLPGIAFDLDTPDDLDYLSQIAPDEYAKLTQAANHVEISPGD